MIAVIFTGLAAGVTHVLSGPDHLAAVAPLSMTRQGRSWPSAWEELESSVAVERREVQSCAFVSRNGKEFRFDPMPP